MTCAAATKSLAQHRLGQLQHILQCFILFCPRPSATPVAAIHLWLRLSELEFLHFSMQPFGAPAAPAGLGPPRVLMLMVIVVVVRSHALGRYCFLLHHKSINSSQFSVLHYCVSGRMSLVMAISDGNFIILMSP